MPSAPLELCPVCRNGNLYQFDFNNRCCRARFSARLADSALAEKLEAMAERYGPDYAAAHRQDVEAYKASEAYKTHKARQDAYLSSLETNRQAGLSWAGMAS